MIFFCWQPGYGQRLFHHDSLRHQHPAHLLHRKHFSQNPILHRPAIIPVPDTSTNALSHQVYGWHPEWMGETYKGYDYSLLSTISYFSFQVVPRTGQIQPDKRDLLDSLLAFARKRRCRVEVTISSIGTRPNNELFTRPAAVASLVKNIAALARRKKLDGITLDFENVPKSHQASFLAFTKSLDQALKDDNAATTLSLCLPPVDYNGFFAVKALAGLIDRFLLMGYDYNYSQSKLSGPVAPLSSPPGQLSVMKSIRDYLGKGVPKNKLLLGVPYYGIEWDTQTGKAGSKIASFINHRLFSYYKASPMRVSRQFHNNSSFLSYELLHAREWRQSWFEDEKNLGAKYDSVKKAGLAGVAIFALGYDHPYRDLWQLLQNKFAVPGASQNASAQTDTGIPALQPGLRPADTLQEPAANPVTPAPPPPTATEQARQQAAAAQSAAKAKADSTKKASIAKFDFIKQKVEPGQLEWLGIAQDTTRLKIIGSMLDTIYAEKFDIRYATGNQIKALNLNEEQLSTLLDSSNALIRRWDWDPKDICRGTVLHRNSAWSCMWCRARSQPINMAVVVILFAALVGMSRYYYLRRHDYFFSFPIAIITLVVILLLFLAMAAITFFSPELNDLLDKGPNDLEQTVYFAIAGTAVGYFGAKIIEQYYYQDKKLP